MKKNWRLQCLICKHSRKMSARAAIVCTKRVTHGHIYYGSDIFTGRIDCAEFDPMHDPFKKAKQPDTSGELLAGGSPIREKRKELKPENDNSRI